MRPDAVVRRWSADPIHFKLCALHFLTHLFIMDEVGMEDRIMLLKLRRIDQLNAKLQTSLKRDRIPASLAASLIIENSHGISDALVPYLWKLPPGQNKYRVYQEKGGVEKADCCVIV